MCGFAGFLTFDPNMQFNALEVTIATMSRTLRHRGPDDAGVWCDPKQGVALGHQRLSILDLSANGHQPMESTCGRYIIVYNGEIYNFLGIKEELLGEGLPLCGDRLFRGHSDTEVLLAAITNWGLERTLERVNGMFAFAIWDRVHKRLTLARDRFGKKPLYFGWVNGAFVFGSELKALRAHPGFTNSVNRQALTLFLRHNCIPAPYSIYQDIYKLPAGSVMQLPLPELRRARSYIDVASNIKRYWLAEQVASQALSEPLNEAPDAIMGRFDTLLRDAVASRMIADVPLGAFLSGGIDSSLVVALMQAQAGQSVKTFSIGFEEAAHNEAEDARRVAAHLGTEHHELILSPRDVLDVVPGLSEIYDEPFADSSQIPTYLVSKFARNQVTVALSGDGGDELFGGYNRYIWAPAIWQKMALWPMLFRATGAALLESIPPRIWPKLMELLGSNHRTPADKMQKLADVLRSTSPASIYQTLLSHWKQPMDIVIDGKEPLTRLQYAADVIDNLGFANGMMILDQLIYLHDDILVKVDRASMAVSLEVRAPLLDYRLAEFAARLPMSLKIHEGQGKYLLRQLLYRYVPRDLIDRPKMGFEMPIADWLRGSLREWAEDLLSESRLRSDGYFYPGPIRDKWQQHLEGKRNWQFHLWDILMFQAWLDESR